MCYINSGFNLFYRKLQKYRTIGWIEKPYFDTTVLLQRAYQNMIVPSTKTFYDSFINFAHFRYIFHLGTRTVKRIRGCFAIFILHVVNKAKHLEAVIA